MRNYSMRALPVGHYSYLDCKFLCLDLDDTSQCLSQFQLRMISVSFQIIRGIPQRAFQIVHQHQQRQCLARYLHICPDYKYA
ncbi:hypothetical protein FGO68_gene3989 [Halteria grandinella]|uniref:Uncharacterized protein n=1 Tax=Halteria grandinella TaxID=5974 RepID=A0A8J8SXE7_HALGN|nr:hypothetical protein FGO68_gene3989 [Halteria grandinella]